MNPSAGLFSLPGTAVTFLKMCLGLIKNLSVYDIRRGVFHGSEKWIESTLFYTCGQKPFQNIAMPFISAKQRSIWTCCYVCPATTKKTEFLESVMHHGRLSDVWVILLISFCFSKSIKRLLVNYQNIQIPEVQKEPHGETCSIYSVPIPDRKKAL